MKSGAISLNHPNRVHKKNDTDVLVDETYFSALFGYDAVFPISDENFATELHLQEALLSSLVASTVGVNHHPQVDMNLATQIKQEAEASTSTVVVDINPQVDMNLATQIKQEAEASASTSTVVVDQNPQVHRNLATQIKQAAEIDTEKDPAESSRRFCNICMEEKPSSDIFRGTTNCTHSYCTDCTIRYVATKIKESAARIKCPDVECTRLIEPYSCRDLIPKDVFDRWEKILCESLIVSWDKYYCPFKDCLAMMVSDDGGNDANVTQTECPSCHRLFCLQCKVAWHAGVGCEEFQKCGNTKKKSSDEEDALLIKMAKRKEWRRCSNCKFYVEKREGCRHITCRCGFQFCYGCGSKWVFSHVCKIRTKRPIYASFD